MPQGQFQAVDLGNGQWKVTLSDGRTATVSAKTQPTEEEILGFASPQTPPPSQTATKQPSGPYGTGWNPLDIMKSVGGELKQGAQSAYESAKNPDNWPMMAGMALGMGSGAVTNKMGLIPSLLTKMLAAGAGGAAGEGAKEYVQGEKLDPYAMATQGGTQALWEGVPHLASRGFKRGGSTAYASGAGLTRAGFSQNFPTAAQEGLEGGRLSAPIITAAGARRVYNRVAPMQGEAIDNAMQNGVKGPTAIDIIRKGYPQMVNEIREGSDLPKDELKASAEYAREFIKQHSRVQPARTVQQNTGFTGNNGQPITQAVRIPELITPINIPLDEANALKQGVQARAKESMKAVNNDKLPGIAGRSKRAVALGAQQTIEEKVPEIKEINRRIQGLTGLNQSLNPSFRSPTELIDMGVDPEVAQSMTSNATSSFGQRVFGDLVAASLAGGGTFATSGNPLMALLGGASGAAAFHIGASPTSRRVLGAGLYVGGRALPNAVRMGRVGEAMSEDSDKREQEILKKALQNGR